MTVIGFLSTAPATDESMAEAVAGAIEAIDETGLAYETGPMGTTIEADSMGELLAAVEAAHESIDADRVSTFLKVDDKRTSDESASEKVAAVEDHLGREARGDRN
ncbi:MTH1187 family thiamine-binding protein [Halovivax limisalsi]|uniref:MTH1187 family thiamine-binding protein n=1 Tax=Halovivax limisalsi TaxID=1453760 RepID=UPI001FFDBB18|nr:MTH1187 family thiamine-binding protein [Halovivax limisalsi]